MSGNFLRVPNFLINVINGQTTWASTISVLAVALTVEWTQELGVLIPQMRTSTCFFGPRAPLQGLFSWQSHLLPTF